MLLLLVVGEEGSRMPFAEVIEAGTNELRKLP